MRKFKKVFAAMLAVVMIGSMSTSVFAEEPIGNSLPEHQKSYISVIESYWDKVNNGEWNDWLNSYAPAVREEYHQLIADESNHMNNIGILTVTSADVTNIYPVADSFIPTTYTDMIPNLMSGTDCSAYIVDVEMRVKEDNGYFKNGINTFLITLVNEGENSYVNAVSTWNSVSAYEDLGYGFQNYISEPTEIKVKYKDGTIATITMDKFIFVTTCNEIGNEGYKSDAIKANAVAIKMCGWWAKAGKFYPVGGYDIPYGKVAIDSVNNASSANQKIVQTAVDGIKGKKVLSSGGKLFYMAYFAGTYSDYGQGTGQMRQNGSSYLADQGSDWKAIITHFYNNSSYNNDGVGAIQIS